MSGLPVLSGTLEELLAGDALSSLLGAQLPRWRWFAAKTRKLAGIGLRPLASVPLPGGRTLALTQLRAHFTEGDHHSYCLPLTLLPLEQAATLPEPVALARVHSPAGEVLLVDALADPVCANALLDLIAGGGRLTGPGGTLRAHWQGELPPPQRDPQLLRGEQSNSAIRYGDQFFLKLYRRLVPGPNPDLEVSRFLTDRQFPATPPLRGWLELWPSQGEPSHLAVVHAFVLHQGDGWTVTLAILARFLAHRTGECRLPPPPSTLEKPSALPGDVAATLAETLPFVRQLGYWTATLHRTLASAPDDPAFAPARATPAGQRALVADLRARWRRLRQLLGRRTLPSPAQADAEALLAAEARFRQQVARLEALRPVQIRCHGDLHLGQVLIREGLPLFIDFEGEPARPLAERRAKHSPLRDVAGMLRSFHYAAAMAGLGNPWASWWQGWVSTAYLAAYLEQAHGAPFLPAAPEETTALLTGFLLEKALYEVEYELDHRPDWVALPLAGLRQLLEHCAQEAGTD
ncbi:MAG: putative maltokinase [Chloroflexi bacterium]|nr:putative maltokinase [Chloroflexota bacterium]